MNTKRTWAELRARVIAWRDADPDLRTRTELDVLLAAADDPIEAADDSADSDDLDELDDVYDFDDETWAARADLADRFAGHLEFGTAGLRAAMGAGPNRMNRAVVITAAAGLAAYLRERVPGLPHVVVGYDARTDSDVFARDTAAVLTAAGVATYVLPRPLPTPVLAFAVRSLDADAGVMVTASHNPAKDNGYKVYLGGRAEPGDGRGVQIVPPADAHIARCIAAVGRAIDVPLTQDGWETLDGGIVEDYLDAVVALVDPAAPREVDIVLTPLHGVGGDIVRRAFEAAGFPPVHLVTEQATPDPAFPTVAFPNPEEQGALDLALAAATRRGADLVVANDPDADRCAVAVPVPDGSPSPWRTLRGDELGALLGEYLLRRGPLRGAWPANPAVASTIVSSQLLRAIAAQHGVRHVETLTGFKWLARVPDLVFAYEEAIGYCVAPQVVRDKDGISTALLVAELAARLKAQGRTLLDELDEVTRRHGVHATEQLSVRVDDLSEIEAMMARLRARPPASLAGRPVISHEDLLHDSDLDSPRLPPTDALRWRTADGIRVVVRPSGTEPKLKCYLEVIAPVEADCSLRDLADARSAAARTLRMINDELRQALGHE